MKKASNVRPANAVKPDAPKAPPTTSITHKRMAIIFNEWARRYSENPEEFSNILDEDGSPVDDYGDMCAIYFHKLAAELDNVGNLPKPKIEDC